MGTCDFPLTYGCISFRDFVKLLREDRDNLIDRFGNAVVKNIPKESCTTFSQATICHPLRACTDVAVYASLYESLFEILCVTLVCLDFSTQASDFKEANE